MKTRLIFIGSMIVIVASLFVWSTQTTSISNEELRTLGVLVLPERKTTPELSLISHEGLPFTKDSLKEKWSFVFFGYTHCPDICPITIAQIGQAELRLATNAEFDILAKIRPVFISIDSKRDGHEKVAKFIGNTSDRFVGVTGNAQEIKALADFAGIGFKRMGSQTMSSEDEYLIEHRDYIAIFDPEGDLFGYIKPPFETDHLARIFRGLAESNGDFVPVPSSG